MTAKAISSNQGEAGPDVKQAFAMFPWRTCFAVRWRRHTTRRKAVVEDLGRRVAGEPGLEVAGELGPGAATAHRGLRVAEQDTAAGLDWVRSAEGVARMAPGRSPDGWAHRPVAG